MHVPIAPWNSASTSILLLTDTALQSCAAARNVVQCGCHPKKLHEAYGGVVPELASRAHQSNIVPTVHTALEQAGVTLDDLEGVAFTQGPGLMGSLLVGTSFAKSLAQARSLPVVGINHMEAHILAHFIADTPNQAMPDFPFLCLTVSGGHTQDCTRQQSRRRCAGQKPPTMPPAKPLTNRQDHGLPYPGGPW